MATAVVVGVSTGVLKLLITKLSKLLEDESAKLKGKEEKIKALRDELHAMSTAHGMLADAEDLNPVMTDWKNKLRELSYDIEDFVDSLPLRADRVKLMGFDGIIPKVMKLKQRHDTSSEIEKLMERATAVSERHKRYNFAELSSNSTTSASNLRLPALYEGIDRLVGIDGPKKQIIEELEVEKNGLWASMALRSKSSAKLKVVSIAGCGGLGKTALAKQVFHTIKGQFRCTAFVPISRRPDMRQKLRLIADGVGARHIKQDDEEQQLIDKLREHLQNKRYLIVIDDVWDTKHWETTKLALLNNNRGSRIITTTRSAEVASSCCSQGGYVYKMKPLSSDDSKRLFFRRAFDSENSHHPELEDVQDQILKKCGGLPLAIITLSSMLAHQSAKAEWNRVLNAIGSGLANKPEAENMTSILSLSYFDIPQHLKTCLLYLSVFPEDYIIEKYCLINRWIAEGFIPVEQGRSAFETGERYFNDLINRSLIRPVDVKYGEAKSCQVHDVILDFIKCKAADENFVTSLDATTEHQYSSEYKVRRLCVCNDNEENGALLTGLILSHVRSLTIFGHPVQNSLSDFTALRVLDLRECEDIEDRYLRSIEKLLHLRYLSLPLDSVTMLPEGVGELQYLQILDVRGSRIKKLPPTIGKLQQLTHLYVSNGTIIPDGTIGQLHSLEVLMEYGVQSYQQETSLQEFSMLTKLRTLTIRRNSDTDDSERMSADVFNSHVGTLLASCNLHDLHIFDSSSDVQPQCLDSWHPAASCRLWGLSFKSYPIYKVPNWMGTLRNLEVLKLQIVCVRSEDVEILGALPRLLFLELATAGGTRGRIVVYGSNGFRCLKHFSLEIHYCGTAVKFEAGSMPKLEYIELRFPLHKMECLNGASDLGLGIQHLSALKNVEVKAGSLRMVDDQGAHERVFRAMETAVETFPNHPTFNYHFVHKDCKHFEDALRGSNVKMAWTESPQPWVSLDGASDVLYSNPTSMQSFFEWTECRQGWQIEDVLPEDETSEEEEEEQHEDDDADSRQGWAGYVFGRLVIVLVFFTMCAQILGLYR